MAINNSKVISPNAPTSQKPTEDVQKALKKEPGANKFKALNKDEVQKVLGSTPQDAEKDPPSGPRYKTFIEVTIGEKRYNNLDGDFLYSPHITLGSRQYSHSKFILNDLDGKIMESIKEGDEVKIKIGFADGEKREKLVGKIWAFGRQPPDGTVVVVVDPSMKMAGADSAAHSSAEQPNPENRADNADIEKQLHKKTKIPDSKLPKNDGSKIDTSSQGTSGSPAFDLLVKVIQEQSAKLAAKQLIFPTAERQSYAPGMGGKSLQFEDKGLAKVSKGGDVAAQTSRMKLAEMAARLKGDVIVTHGNTVKQIGPGQGEASGVVLDYGENRAQFVGKPEFLKRTGLQLASSKGAITVVAPNIENKTVDGVTAFSTPGGKATPGGTVPLSVPSGNIKVPDKDSINLSDYIFQGCPYTWKDAFDSSPGGFMKPESQEVVEKAAAIAQQLTKLTQQAGQSKFTITSWYRPPWYNLQVASSGPNGPHTWGHAVDWWFDGAAEFHDKIKEGWVGGIALALPCMYFVHTDLGKKRYWGYC